MRTPVISHTFKPWLPWCFVTQVIRYSHDHLEIVEYTATACG